MFDPKKLGEEADQMIQQLNQNAAEDSRDQAESEDAIAQDDVVTTASTLQDDEDTTATAEPQPSASAELEFLRKQVEAAEQKWRVLQGMINKKDEEIEAMRQLFASLNAKQTDSAQSSSSAPSQVVSDADMKEFGADLVNLIERVATAAAANMQNKIMAELNERFGQIEGSVQQVEQITAKTAQEMFFDSLTTAVPNWRELNTDPAFLSWLDKVDAFTGLQRLQLLRDAVANHNVQRAAAFFTTFMAEQGTAQKTQPTSVKNIEKFVAPGKSKASVPKADSNRRIWSRSEIAKLYDDKMAGRISAKEFAELERDLFAAQHEGRIAA